MLVSSAQCDASASTAAPVRFPQPDRSMLVSPAQCDASASTFRVRHTKPGSRKCCLAFGGGGVG